MRLLNATLLAISLATLTVGAEAPKGFPERAIVPDPMPGPVVPAPIRLTEDAIYVADFDQDGAFRVHPRGRVKVDKIAGPVRFARTKFADGNGGLESRTYTGKWVYQLEAVASGPVEIDFVPFGLKTETEIKTTTVEVVAGKVVPEPKPVDPITPVVVTTFRVILIHESSKTLTPAQTGVLYSKNVADWLNAHCTKDDVTPGWRRYDKDIDAANDYPVIKALWTAVKPQVTAVPCVAVEVNGKVDIIPFPMSEKDALDTLKRYAGEK